MTSTKQSPTYPTQVHLYMSVPSPDLKAQLAYMLTELQCLGDLRLASLGLIRLRSSDWCQGLRRSDIDVTVNLGLFSLFCFFCLTFASFTSLT